MIGGRVLSSRLMRMRKQQVQGAAGCGRGKKQDNTIQPPCITSLLSTAKGQPAAAAGVAPTCAEGKGCRPPFITWCRQALALRTAGWG